MKELSKIKLNQIRKSELDQRELNALRGGCDCGCMCLCFGPSDDSGKLAVDVRDDKMYGY